MPSPTDISIRLREQAAKSLDPNMEKLNGLLQDLKDSVGSSLEGMEQCVRHMRSFDFGGAEAFITEALQEAVAAGRQGAHEERERDLDFLAHFARDVRKKETQEEILSLLLDAAGRFAPRAALFVAREGAFIGWSSRGYSAGVAADITRWSAKTEESPFLDRALRADGLTSTTDLSGEARLSRLLGGESRQPWHAFPMRAIRRPVAVLQAAGAEGRECDLEMLCVLLDLTGLSIENLALKILQEMKQTVSVAASPAPAETEAEAQAVEEAPAAAETQAPAEADEPLPLLEDEAPAEEMYSDSRAEDVVEETEPLHAGAASEVEMAEEPAREPAEYADQRSEELVEAAEEPPAVEEEPAVPPDTAPEGLPQPVVEAGQEPTPTAPEEDESPRPAARLREVQPLSEDEKLHAEARRFARLLVQEIKLYNEQQVAEGRNQRDLYVRLKRDVDRSREMYEKRISSAVAQKADYFHEEVVRILAAEDPAALGREYPGPRVVD